VGLIKSRSAQQIPSIRRLSGFFAAWPHALTARRIRRMLAQGFANLYTSAAELNIAAVAPSNSNHNLWSTL
jgi:hypothetical protein